MSRLTASRRAAWRVLVRAEGRSGFVRELLDADGGIRALDARGRAFATRLALGTAAASGTLDEILDGFLAKPRKVSRPVRLALRMAAFEILYLGTPDAVSVDQGVELARLAGRGTGGLANAVLRRVAAHREGFLTGEGLAEPERGRVSAARRGGLPRWLYGEVSASIGEEAARSLAACELEPAPVWAHPIAVEDGEAAAPPAGAHAAATPFPRCLRIWNPAALASDAAAAAAFCVSDLAAQAVATAGVRPGSCLELGAGRGTKTLVMASRAASLGISREHVAVDLYERKCELNRERLERFGFRGVACVACDARRLRASDAALPDGRTLGRRCGAGFDMMLLDAPCSGTGTMRRHPEIPWRLQPADVDPSQPGSLPRLQSELLREAAFCVASGGELLYATCSVLRAENEEVVEGFLASEEGRGFSIAPFSEAWSYRQPGFAEAAAWARDHETCEGFLRTSPAPDGCDGHFCARLVRARTDARAML